MQLFKTRLRWAIVPCLPFLLAQTPAETPPQEIVKPQEVRPLPGQLDSVPVFNSNSPELVLTEGILLSTFPPAGKRSQQAHLNFPFQGRFDIFAHHVARAEPPENLRTLYLGILLHNPGSQTVNVDILQAASYLSQPDAPFIQLPPVVENPDGQVYAGPGSRVMSDILRNRRQADFPASISIPPGEYRLVLNAPIPVRELTPPLNGRSTLMRLRSSDTVYAASLSQFARLNPDGSERAPNLAEWQQILTQGELVTPRDRTPTPPDATGSIIYGRVAGVARGSQWRANLGNPHLTIPEPGQAFSYGISTLRGGMQGTEQIQTAPMLVRYPDTAYAAHGNYGIHYSLTLPLHNPTNRPQTVTVKLQTPLKEDRLSAGGLRFLDPPAAQVFFRGTVRVRYPNAQGNPQTRFVHLVQRRGQQGEPLATLNLAGGDSQSDPSRNRALVEIDLLYPPDATPPQVLTVETHSLSAE
ncbi:MAG: DUF3370 domain-containing protein [Desertifilum sp. SIO1I2]|nr:DUF3370 domain-containing protein [Desertifilum sp. SIO1I2]